MKLITDTSALNKELFGLAKGGAKLAQRLHIAALSVLAHIEQHGDVRMAQKLVETVMSAKHSKHEIRSWIVSFGKVSEDEEGNLVFDRTKFTDLAGANEKPFWEFKPVAPQKAYDLQQAIKNLIKKAKTEQAKGNLEHAELLSALEVLQ
jgi:hypothetical protein